MSAITPALYAGSRMHVLDWVEGCGGDFVDSLNGMLWPTGVVGLPGGHRRPEGYGAPAEALLDRPCEPLLPPEVSHRVRTWWLAVNHPAASGPNWDLVAQATFPGEQRGLVLVEAKAHVGELEGEVGGKKLSATASANSQANHARIAAAIGEARDALGGRAAGVRIDRDTRYQFSNRVAFAWKLASEGVPVALVYLGFTGDGVIGRLSKPIRDDAHWRGLVAAHTTAVLPAELWERPIDVRGTPLWLLARSIAIHRLSPEQRIEA